MSPRAVVRHQQWTLQPDREPDAEPTSYAMQCAVCGEISPTDTEFTASQNWVFAHGGRNPTHHTYREVITRPWKAWWKP
ncbi:MULTISPECIES: DUF7848 domain-containing protein [Streptomyces]|uniref:DUF7848 domain-containing protein n=1 Tax=Streptomyces salyersiae TaxID=3075530 RepID=A0ABU2RI65_9ACTN|nr:hypothetical protein [Streptomyces sp. DSM 41770]MDT0428499.1 hypothetical protein [Streptomyces sp. DSM 41770]